MDLWDKDAIDLVEPGFITFNGEEGEMRFIAVRAWLDVRYRSRDGVLVAEFSWEGIDEGDQRSGRGWATPRAASRPYLLPQWGRFRLRLRAPMTSSTAC